MGWFSMSGRDLQRVEVLGEVLSGHRDGSCPQSWFSNREALVVSGVSGRACQAATAGRLTMGSSPRGAMVSSVM